jgi:hypothetical protein
MCFEYEMCYTNTYLRNVVTCISTHFNLRNELSWKFRIKLEYTFQVFVVGIVQIDGVLRLCNANTQKTTICPVKMLYSTSYQT